MFGGGSFPASSVQEDASGNFFTINESGGQSDMVFGTQNGLFAVDTGNGTILGSAQSVVEKLLRRQRRNLHRACFTRR